MVRAGRAFVAGIHPSRTWTSGSLESVRWNACVHRLDLGLYSHPSFWGSGVWTHVNSKGKIPSTGKFPQRRIELATLWTAIPAPAIQYGTKIMVQSNGKYKDTKPNRNPFINIWMQANNTRFLQKNTEAKWSAIKMPCNTPVVRSHKPIPFN